MGKCGDDEVLIRDAISARTTIEGKGVALGSGVFKQASSIRFQGCLVVFLTFCDIHSR
jgi:hypothetical protein